MRIQGKLAVIMSIICFTIIMLAICFTSIKIAEINQCQTTQPHAEFSSRADQEPEINLIKE